MNVMYTSLIGTLKITIMPEMMSVFVIVVAKFTEILSTYVIETIEPNLSAMTFYFLYLNLD